VPPSLGRVTPASLSSLGAKDLGQSVSDPIGAVDLKGHLRSWPLSAIACRMSTIFLIPHSMELDDRRIPRVEWHVMVVRQKWTIGPGPAMVSPTKDRLAAGPFQILLSRVPDV